MPRRSSSGRAIDAYLAGLAWQAGWQTPTTRPTRARRSRRVDQLGDAVARRTPGALPRAIRATT